MNLFSGVEIPEGVPTFKYEDYVFVEQIGRSGTGESWKVEKVSTGEPFKVKSIFIHTDERDDEEHKARIMHDMKLATSLNHPNIMRCIGVCISIRGIHFLYNWIPFTLYYACIRDEAILAKIAYQVLQGLDYIAKEKGIVFKHLTPGNILYDSSSDSYKIADVGTVKDKYITLNYVAIAPMFMKYIAPENYHLDNGLCDLQSERYSKSYVWSLGLCLLQFYNDGAYPFDERKRLIQTYLLSGFNFEYGKAEVWWDCDVWPPRPPNDAPPLFRHFISSCLNLDVSMRASVDELLKHQLITTHCSHLDLLHNAHAAVVSEEGDSSDDTEQFD